MVLSVNIVMRYLLIIFCLNFLHFINGNVYTISKKGFQARGFSSSRAYENALEIKEKIENFNMQFFGHNLRLNPEDPDPKGYTCEISPYFAYELEFEEELLCFNKTIPLCAMVIYTLKK